MCQDHKVLHVTFPNINNVTTKIQIFYRTFYWRRIYEYMVKYLIFVNVYIKCNVYIKSNNPSILDRFSQCIIYFLGLCVTINKVNKVVFEFEFLNYRLYLVHTMWPGYSYYYRLLKQLTAYNTGLFTYLNHLSQ